MSNNTFGRLFRFTTWGESHGPSIGCVVDGVPPGITIAINDIQNQLDLRRPGTSKFVTQRKELDRIEILSGVFDGKSTGSPISMIIENTDQRSKDYSLIADKFRPGHADYTYEKKYGIRDYRGGGRASARETAARVAAGAIARFILGKKIKIRGALIQVGELGINQSKWSWSEILKNPFFCPDRLAASEWGPYLDKIRKNKSSVGAIVQISVSGIPAGLGSPIYGKLDADLASAMMGINAVKGVEIGAGFEAARLSGSENGDEMRSSTNKNPKFLSNNAGGILGGISTGQEIIIRFAVKPTSSIPIQRKTITKLGKNTEITTKGRHDPCVGIRAVPVGEAMAACVLADHMLQHRALTGK